MKIQATGRNVATRNSKRTKKKRLAPLRTLIKRPMHICPVLGYIHHTDWLNVWNVKGQ